MTQKAFIVAAAAVAGVMGMASGAFAYSVLDMAHLANEVQVRYGGGSNVGAYSAANPRSGTFFQYRDGGGDKIQDTVQQTYFWRIGNSGPATELNDGTTAVATLDPAGVGRVGQVVYSDNLGRFDVTINYILTGTANGKFGSTVDRQISVKNKTNAPLDFQLFSYNDYTLTGVTAAKPAAGDPYADNDFPPPGGGAPVAYEFAQIKTVNGKLQADQWDTYPTPGGPVVSALRQTFDTPVAFETGVKPDGSSPLLTKLLNGTALVNNTNVVGGGNSDDVEFALQWNLSIGAGNSKVVTEKTAIIPEPASLALLTLGGLLTLGRRRSR